MIWPFKDSGKNKREIARLSVEASQSRNRFYDKLFELDKLDRRLDGMVQKSLNLLDPGQKNDPPNS